MVRTKSRCPSGDPVRSVGAEFDGVSLKKSGEDGSRSFFISKGLSSESVGYVAIEVSLFGVMSDISTLFVFEGSGWKISGVPFEASVKGS